MTKRGFTLVELLIALVLMSIVTAAIYQVLVTNQRTYRAQIQRVELNDNLRAAVAILPSELRELNTADPLGSDIIVMSDSAIKYKAMRGIYIMCAAPDLLNLVIYLSPVQVWGLRPINANRDSVLIFDDFSPSSSQDDRWIHANVAGSTTGTNCPGATPSIDVVISGASATLDSVVAGNPVRSFEVVEMLRYPDGSGNHWIGMRQYGKDDVPGTVQPMVGPLATGGLKFTFFDANGNATDNVTAVARVGIEVVGRTAQPVRTSTGGLDHVVDTLQTHVTLRNR